MRSWECLINSSKLVLHFILIFYTSKYKVLLKMDMIFSLIQYNWEDDLTVLFSCPQMKWKLVSGRGVYLGSHKFHGDNLHMTLPCYSCNYNLFLIVTATSHHAAFHRGDNKSWLVICDNSGANKLRWALTLFGSFICQGYNGGAGANIKHNTTDWFSARAERGRHGGQGWIFQQGTSNQRSKPT